MEDKNYTLLCDFYELTMGNGYLQAGLADRIVYFDLFYRENPDKGGFAICCGLEQVVDYIRRLHFTEEDIAFLRGKGCFSEEFLAYLRNFRFSGDIWAIPEGTVVFPGEPLVTVRAPAIEAQLIETYMLMMVNHQSLIATKAARVTRSAAGRPVSEFGSRRAQGASAAILGARAAYIGGASSTACTIVERDYGVPASGTMAHSWVQMFDTEYEAFRTYCELYPNNCTLLIDTYNVLESGLPNAMRAFREVLVPKGITKCAIRIDSGDVTYLTKKVRAILDANGFTECKIVISNSMDEYVIRELIRQGACIDVFGVGERLITSKTEPVFGGVYKLCAVEKNGVIEPKIKISENVGKITTPHFKKVYRLRDKETGKAEADMLCVYDEDINDSEPIELFDPEYTWKRKTLRNYTATLLQQPIFKNGELVYKEPTLSEIRHHCAEEIQGMWDEVRRFNNPHNYYVDLSQKLWDIKYKMLSEYRNRKK